MTARRKATAVTVLAAAPVALTALTATPAVAHGSMTDPVSRVSACYAEGPESPESAACRAAVAASGAQAFYDWNEVNIANAAGNHRQLIPDGKLCSAGRDKYRGLDLPRTDWPASKLTAGDHTFRYKGTAPHKGSFELYITKDGFDPSKPLKWSDLEGKPFARVADPKLVNGEYVFEGTVPSKSGRHLVYSIWQRSDSPEAFYTCSDVVFGKDGSGSAPADGGSPAPVASTPAESRTPKGGDGSADHGGQHGLGAEGQDAAPPEVTEKPETPETQENPEDAEKAENTTRANSAGADLAETGGSGSAPYLAAGGAAVVALGAAAV
ncbi:lytic polysaccharide monooxygenase, partial [Streptomyces sp. NPDC127084]|uniref:lytic polysaccharide monooxygenase auxiliary activity family 9 protein n=1 Tax=Streptomyces sp. NPDC127084 TaxID=3347133 RepID=UPI003650FE5F